MEGYFPPSCREMTSRGMTFPAKSLFCFDVFSPAPYDSVPHVPTTTTQAMLHTTKMSARHCTCTRSTLHAAASPLVYAAQFHHHETTQVALRCLKLFPFFFFRGKDMAPWCPILSCNRITIASISPCPSVCRRAQSLDQRKQFPVVFFSAAS